MSVPNYNGKQANNSAYIKNFVYGLPASLWKTISYTLLDGTTLSALTPTHTANLYVPGDLIVDGTIVTPSDAYLKQNIMDIDTNTANKLLKLEPKVFDFKRDFRHVPHYGMIAQEVECVLPELVQCKPDTSLNNIKTVNYIELIPLLVRKIQIMQNEIDALKNIVNK